MPNLSRTNHAPNFEVAKICVHAYFEDIRGMINELYRCHETYVRATESLSAVRYDTDLICFKGNPLNGAEDALERRLTAYRLYMDAYENTEKQVNHANTLLKECKNGKLLHSRYIKGWNIAVIAKSEGITPRAVHNRLNAGILALYAIMPEEYRRYSIPDAQPCDKL